MTESPFVKAEGPETPNVADILSERHQGVLAQVDATILDQLTRQAVLSSQTELARQRNRLAQATDELNRVSNLLRLAEAKLFDRYQLTGQLVGFLDSIEWGTHDEWTRSQSLRERAHEYVSQASNTIAT